MKTVNVPTCDNNAKVKKKKNSPHQLHQELNFQDGPIFQNTELKIAVFL